MSIIFNGSSQYCSIANNTSLNITGAVSIGAWFNITAPADWTYIFAKAYDGETGLYWLAHNNVANTLWCGIRWGTGTTQYNEATATSATLFNGTWHHVFMTFDTTTLILYVDGVAGTPVTTGGSSIISGTHSTVIGAYDPAGDIGGGLGLYWGGSIDEVRLYNRALSEAEISTIYSSKCCDELVYSLVSKWPLKELGNAQTATGAGTVRDYGNNGNHMTPSNSPTYTYSILKQTKYSR